MKAHMGQGLRGERRRSRMHGSISPYSTEKRDPTQMKLTHKENGMYMAKAKILRLGANATFIPLTRVGVSHWG